MSNSKAQEIHIVNRHFKLLLMDINSSKLIYDIQNWQLWWTPLFVRFLPTA